MAGETLLDQRIQEVIRVLPQAQAAEIRRYDQVLGKAATGIEFGTYFVPHSPYHRPPKPIGWTVVPTLARGLVWRDLQLAEGNDFPGLSPQRAMYLGRSATEMAQRFADRREKSSDAFLSSAVGLIGLHMSVLGSMELIESDGARQLLDWAEATYNQQFIQPLARASAAYKQGY